jgi:hypothetical protein
MADIFAVIFPLSKTLHSEEVDLVEAVSYSEQRRSQSGLRGLAPPPQSKRGL